MLPDCPHEPARRALQFVGAYGRDRCVFVPAGEAVNLPGNVRRSSLLLGRKVNDMAHACSPLTAARRPLISIESFGRPSPSTSNRT